MTVRVRAKAQDGAANEAVIATVAAHFGVARSKAALVRGGRSRVKLLEVER